MKADLHIHTNFSYDAVSSPKEVVDSALKKGIQCICITDHGQVKGAVAAMKYAFDKDILVVPGIEILSLSGDVLGINVKKIIPNGLSLEETVLRIEKQGGLAVVPHPFAWPAIAGFWGDYKKMASSGITGVEACNASVIFPFSNNKALAFSKESNLSFTAGSDAHRADFIGRGYIETSNLISSEKNLLEKILERKAEIKGSRLSLKELMANTSKANLSKVARYYLVKFFKRDPAKPNFS
jgi:predicted metal-dependent phosphoesterase TrpH